MSGKVVPDSRLVARTAAHVKHSGEATSAVLRGLALEGLRVNGYPDLERILLRAEARIGLVGRCQPENAPSERARLAQAALRGEALVTAFRYAPLPDLSELKRTLDACANALRKCSLSSEHGLASLYAERCEELLLEAELAERVGTPRFFELARRRYPADSGADGQCADAQSLGFAQLRSDPEPWPLITSDDAGAPASLLSTLTRSIGALKLPFRVEVSERLSALAATGLDVVYVQPRALLSERQAQRIAEHEIRAHVMPRVLARTQACGLLRVGSAGAADDEEGRALLIEERSGLMDSGRRRELGLRHRAALALAGGADWSEGVRLLRQLGCGVQEAVDICGRVGRGGGLCRELVYLPAWLRAKRILDTEPELERWLERGRLSFAAARALGRFEHDQW